MVLIAVCSFFLPLIQDSHAAHGGEYGVGRIRSCSGGAVEGLDHNFINGGKDAEFTLEPLCLAVIARIYTTVKLAIPYMNKNCKSGSATIRILPSPILDAIDIAKATTQVAMPGCKGPYLAALGAFSTALAEMNTIYIAANHVYKNSRVCGADWLKPNIADYNISTPNYKNILQTKIEKIMEEELLAGTSNEDSVLNLETNKEYREWFYQGKEIEDHPVSGSYCQDVGREKVDGAYPRQRYYLQGLEAGNYNCKKYDIGEGQNDPLTPGIAVSETRRLEFKAAHDCCKKRSSAYICIDYNKHSATNTVTNDTTSTKGRFCKAGSECLIDSITFKAEWVDSGRLICADTKSICPYNFSLGGGTEYCDYYRDGIWNENKKAWDMITQQNIDDGECDTKSEIRDEECTYNQKAGKCRNYCQFQTHCTRTAGSDYDHTSSVGSPYFSSACRNFVGDSQNRTAASNGGFLLSSQTHFSAPIAQCVKETIENLFHNRAGHSRCLESNEYPSANGVCPSGNYVNDGFIFKKGNTVNEESFFATIQKFMHKIVLLVIILSVTFYGMNILLAKVNLADKKTILIYLLKIGLVMYFAMGQAWQTQFFNGVYGASSEFAMMVFQINQGQDETKRDGCQFGHEAIEKGTIKEYPPGKQYLAIWDTLDCKLLRYMGMGPTASPANIAMLALAAFFTGSGIGLYFAMSVFIFAFFFLAATMRALHIFLASNISIIIMVFVSPIIIPMVLFDQTKDIFNKWFTNLISFILQPMILFAYIAMFITILDISIIGSATFHGNPPYKTISCNDYCQDADGTRIGNADECNLEAGQTVVDPLNDSVACLLNFDGYGSVPVLKIIGITIPVLVNIFDGNVKDKIIALLKGALIMFFLYKFMDQISGITSKLVGGSELPGSKADAVGMLASASKRIKSVSKRAIRGGGMYAKSKAESTAAYAAKNHAGGGDDKKGESRANASSKAIDSSDGDNSPSTPEDSAETPDDAK